MITDDLTLHPDVITLRPREALIGARRAQAAAAVAQLYQRGMTVRQIAEKINASYGRVWALLDEGGVLMRGNGYRSVKARGLPGTEASR